MSCLFLYLETENKIVYKTLNADIINFPYSKNRNSSDPLVCNVCQISDYCWWQCSLENESVIQKWNMYMVIIHTHSLHLFILSALLVNQTYIKYYVFFCHTHTHTLTLTYSILWSNEFASLFISNKKIQSFVWALDEFILSVFYRKQCEVCFY